MALVETADSDDAATPKLEADDAGAQPTPKSNANIHDDPLTQKLTMAEIEALKQDDMGSGKELIEKIMQSHSALEQKTAFSLAKYTLRKHKKYMKRFCVLPVDVPTLIDWMMADRDFGKVMEMRNETMGLVGCWANIHSAGHDLGLSAGSEPSSRYLVVDDTGGLLVAAMAERMDNLQPKSREQDTTEKADDDLDAAPGQTEAVLPHKPRRQQYRLDAMSAKSNTLTLIHPNQQPNLAFLRYFGFDSNNPIPSHPLYTTLKTVSWIQLLEPEADIAYREPPLLSAEELAKVKANKRSSYYRKRRRWENVKNAVDATREGGFNGLVVASYTDPVSILRHLVPLLAGGSQVVVYSPNIEPLVKLTDYYSTARRTAFINTPEEERQVPSVEFPVDPSLLLTPTVQTGRVRHWQVLPGRTHPLMTGRGGAEGYTFVATRVLPAEGKVEARGTSSRGRKTRPAENGVESAPEDVLSQSPLKKQKTTAQDTLPALEISSAEDVSKDGTDAEMKIDT